MARGSGSTKIFTIKLSAKTHYGWVGRKETYEGLTTELGVDENEPGSSLPEGTVFGGKSKPPRIRIRTTAGRTFTRFIRPDKLEDQVYKKGLIGKKIKAKKRDASGYENEDICWVSSKNN